MGLIPGLGREDSPGERNGPTPVFLPGEFYGQRSLASSSPWGSQKVRYAFVTKQQQTLTILNLTSKAGLRDCTATDREGDPRKVGDSGALSLQEESGKEKKRERKGRKNQAGVDPDSYLSRFQ